MREFRFNDRFSRLVRDATLLFADIVRLKNNFNQLQDCAPFMTYVVVTRILKKCPVLRWRRNRVLRSIQRYHRATYERFCQNGTVSLCTRRRFARAAESDARFRDVQTLLRDRSPSSTADIELFTRRIDEIYKHTLFENFVAHSRKDIVELLGLVRRLVKETGDIIQKDTAFRNDLIQLCAR